MAKRLIVKGDRVRVNDGAHKFGIRESSRTATVLVTPRSDMVHVKMDDPEIYLHRTTFLKVANGGSDQRSVPQTGLPPENLAAPAGKPEGSETT